MPLFSKKGDSDKEVEDKLEAILARREARKRQEEGKSVNHGNPHTHRNGQSYTHRDSQRFASDGRQPVAEYHQRPSRTVSQTSLPSTASTQSHSVSRKSSEPLGLLAGTRSRSSTPTSSPGATPPLKPVSGVREVQPSSRPSSFQQKRTSRLNVSLSEILSQSSALPYFIQFAESCGALPLVQFWLAVESFRVSTARRLQRKLRASEVRSSSPNPQAHAAVGLTTVALETTGASVDDRHCVDGAKLSTRAITRQQSLIVQRDAMAIYTQYVSMQAKTMLDLSHEVRQQIESDICQEDGFISPEIFTKAQGDVFKVLHDKYHHPFLKSRFYCKFVIEILTTGSVQLCDIMLSDVTAMMFTEFLEQEGRLELFQFWTLADSLQNDIADQIERNQYDNDTAVNDTMALYNRYFSLQASCPLGLGDKVRVAVELAICDESGPRPNCFSLPMSRVYTIMEEEILPVFLSSNSYFYFLSNLLNSVSGRREEMRKSNSEEQVDAHDGEPAAGAELTEETLWSQLHDNPIGIDCGEDPDALWRRVKLPLTFGRITDIGEYVSDLEPCPDESTNRTSLRNRMSRAVRKIISLPVEDTEQLEMAAKIARMIISGVLRETGQLQAWMLQTESKSMLPNVEVATVA